MICGISNIKVNEIEDIEISVGQEDKAEIDEPSGKKLSYSEISQLKKYLSEHYEIPVNIINIK